MRKQTKKMLDLLEQEGAVIDSEATRRGVKNPRLEAGLLRTRYHYPVKITQISDKKREYKLMTD